MGVKLVWVTPDCEKHIMYCARVSNPKNQESNNTKLLDYCIKNKHWSILEMGNLCLEIETSRAISAQILRHRSMNFQEFSQRYSEVQDILKYDARRQDPKNRQNSIDDLPKDTKSWFSKAQEAVKMLAQTTYDEALKKGVAKEQARMLLPMSSKTRIYVNGTIRSWVHYIQLRESNGTQLEHQKIALACKEVFKKELPNISKALGWL